MDAKTVDNPIQFWKFEKFSKKREDRLVTQCCLLCYIELPDLTVNITGALCLSSNLQFHTHSGLTPLF